MWILVENGSMAINTDHIKRISIMDCSNGISIRALHEDGNNVTISTHKKRNEALAELYKITNKLGTYYANGSGMPMIVAKKRVEEMEAE